MKRFLKKVSLAIVVMAFICLGAALQSYGVTYTITDLDTLGSTESWPLWRHFLPMLKKQIPINQGGIL